MTINDIFFEDMGTLFGRVHGVLGFSTLKFTIIVCELFINNLFDDSYLCKRFYETTNISHPDKKLCETRHLY